MESNALLQQLSERLDRLEAENERLRVELEARPNAPLEDDEPVVMSRRNWLARGAAVAAGAVVGGAALSASPVAAVSNPLLLDTLNVVTTSVTGVTGTVPAASNLDMFHSAFQAVNQHGSWGTGLFGYGSSFGVAGHSDVGTGVWGKASGGVGTAAIGVQGYIDNDMSPGSIGVLGSVSGAAQVGVKGISALGYGVRGESTSGTAVSAVSSSGAGVEGVSTTGWGGWFRGAYADMMLGNSNRLSPTADVVIHGYGELVAQNHSDLATSTLWYNVRSGTPGRWRRLAGPDTAGALTVLPAPIRVYDSRPGQPPLAIGPKAPLLKDIDRAVNCTLATSGVPADATAVLLNVTIVSPSASGFVSVRASGVAYSGTSNLNFAAGQVIANSVTSACGAGATVALRLGGPVGLVGNAIVDVVGYYR